MDFNYPPEAEAFRKEFRAWLDENLEDRFKNLGRAIEGDHSKLPILREWNAKLAQARYAAIAWPVEFGGRGAGVMEQVVFAEEMHRAKAPSTVNPLGIANIAPAIMQFGTEDQKRELLPRMLHGEDTWCQGFSEPDAGSDLASLKTTAVLDGDDFIINGQKTWNTLGEIASHCELLVRTDPAVAKHKGISCLLVEMDSPGIEVRPLVSITGGTEFNEIFFTDVRVPKSALLGPINEGWRVAMTTLTYERGGVANLYLGLRSKVRRLIELAKTTEIGVEASGIKSTAADDPVIRQHIARVYLEVECLKLLADRAISGDIHGRKLGPEASLAKLVWSEADQHIADVAAEIMGPAANAGEWGWERIYSRALTIAGGTTQINKNIIAQRILGLPRS